MKKLVIVCITYNHEKFIGQAIESFLKQKTNFEYEILVSDDCSTDSTAKIIKSYIKKYPRKIKAIFRTKNIGSMKNYIDVLSKVKSEYVAICDGDDFWSSETKLQRQVDFLDQNKEYSICFHKTTLFQNDLKVKEIPQLKKNSFELKDLLEDNFIPSSSVIYRWIFNDQKIEDKVPSDIVPLDYYIHLLHAKSGKMYFFNESWSFYRRHSESMWLVNGSSYNKDFFLKYGALYMRFYSLIEKEFNLPQRKYYFQKKNLAFFTIKEYIKSKRFLELEKFYKENIEIANECIEEYQFEPAYKSYNLFNKALYLLLFNKKLLYKKIKDRMKK